MSPKLRKMCLLPKNFIFFFLNFSFWRNPVFSKNLVPYQKPTLYTCTTSSYATNPNNSLLLLQAPAQRAARSFSGTRSCGDIDNLIFLIQFFEKLQKRAGRLGLKSPKGPFIVFDILQQTEVSKSSKNLPFQVF